MTVERIVRDVSGYGRMATDSPAQLEDVRNHVLSLYREVLTVFGAYGRITEEHLEIAREPAHRRIGEVTITDFLDAFGVGGRVLWGAARELATDDAARSVAMQFSSFLIHAMSISAAAVARSYAEAERIQNLSGMRLARHTVDALIAGTSPLNGRSAALAEASGVTPREPLVVLVAQPLAPARSPDALHHATRPLARALASPLVPLSTVRRNEFIAIAPAPSNVERLRAAGSGSDLPLAIGLSTHHVGLEAAADAYHEARLACEALQPRAGFLALPEINTLDYLVRREDELTLRMAPPRALRFIEDDHQRGGDVVETFEAYVDCDFNAQATGHRLGIHPNTVNYRLGKLTEHSGLNVRSVRDVIELLVAVRLFEKGARADGVRSA